MESLKHKLETHFAEQLVECEFNRGELTIHIEAEQNYSPFVKHCAMSLPSPN